MRLRLAPWGRCSILDARPRESEGETAYQTVSATYTVNSNRKLHYINEIAADVMVAHRYSEWSGRDIYTYYVEV